MSVRQHLFTTLALCLTVILAATLALHYAQEHETAALALNFAEERQVQLDDIIQSESSTLSLFIQDYSGWDEMVGFVSTLDPEWARLNIAVVMERFQLGAVWLLARDGTLLYHIAAPGSEALPPPPIPPIINFPRWNAEIGGFYLADGTVIDLRARPVQPTADTDRLTSPVAWLLAARPLNAAYAANLGRKLQAELLLHLAGQTEPATPHGTIAIHHSLPTLFRPETSLAEWHAHFPIPALELGKLYNRSEMLLLITSGLLLFGLVSWSLHRHILRPLALIDQSLSSDSLTPLAKVPPNLPEFVRIAELIRQSVHQREALRHEIKERVSLGRDLHDGVIQNLYATGLVIAHCRRLIPTDPAQALARLEQTHLNLNHTMESLRGFIARAEPEPEVPVRLSDACHTLFQTLRAHRECALHLDIAPEADALFPLHQKATLLFILREAVANALRHGQPRNLHISLAPAASDKNTAKGFWLLRICDDGTGCDLAALRPTGHGLKNIRARAAELGGTASFTTPATGGFEINLRWQALPA